MSALDRIITFQHASEVRDAFGVTTQVWAPIATMRATIVQADAHEALRGAGLESDGAITFRTRHLASLTT